MRHCIIPGCQFAAASLGRHCNTHRSRARRHGHPLQTAVTKGNLKPYLMTVDEVIERNSESPLWSLSVRRWEALVQRSHSVVAAYRNGKALQRNRRQAAQEIVNLADHVAGVEILRTVCAMYLLQERWPQRFQSDEAFLHQLVRRCCGLTEANAGTWYDGATGKVKRAYRDLPPKTVLVMGRQIGEVLGVVGLKVSRLDHQNAADERQASEAFSNALGTLK